MPNLVSQRIICLNNYINYVPNGDLIVRLPAVKKRKFAMERNHAADVSINVYGSYDSMRSVGSALARFGKALQHPDSIDPGIDYQNPHFFQIPGQEMNLNSFVKPIDTLQEMKARVSSEIGEIIDSLDTMDFEYEMPSSQGILTPLLR
ncbi:MAG: hypothetical protein Q9165_008393 [Trypethelium subeluteriae]